jgi:hypothetical protein
MPVLRAEPNDVMEVAVSSGLDTLARSLIPWDFPPVMLVLSTQITTCLRNSLYLR